LGSCCSILIVNWNSWDLLARCLGAISRQSYTDYRVFVADNASDQPPPDEIFSLMPGMVFVQNERNDGFAKANNDLLEQATDSKWVVLLNPDAFPEPDWLEQLLKAASDYPEYQSFASRLIQADNSALLDGEGDCYHISGVAWRKGFGKQAGNSLVPTEVFSPCAAAAMYRTDILLEVGGFDESLERNQDIGTISQEDGRYVVDPDGSGDAPAFAFSNPDFNFRSLRGNAVLRWEFRPGSTLFFVWTHARSDVEPIGTMNLRHDLDALFDAKADNIFLVKLSYWIGL